MKITDVKSAIIGSNIVIRVVTDKGIDGYGEVEEGKDFVKPLVSYYKDLILGCDPTNVEFVMRRIRRAGAFKPWGKIVSTIEMALWDIAGKDAGIPVYKLLGGKVRDRVRVYNGSFGNPNPPHPVADTNQYDHAHPHRRADLPAPELPRTDRKSSGERDWARSG